VALTWSQLARVNGYPTVIIRLRKRSWNFLHLYAYLKLTSFFFSLLPNESGNKFTHICGNCLHLSPTAIFKFHMTELKDRNLISKLATGKNTTCKKISTAFMLVIPTTNPTLPFQSSTLSITFSSQQAQGVCMQRNESSVSRDPRWRLFLACEPSEQFRVFLV
jgi:hypothetical protein